MAHIGSKGNLSCTPMKGGRYGGVHMAWTMGYLLEGHLVSLRCWGACVSPSLFSVMALALEGSDQTQSEKRAVCADRDDPP